MYRHFIRTKFDIELHSEQHRAATLYTIFTCTSGKNSSQHDEGRGAHVSTGKQEGKMRSTAVGPFQEIVLVEKDVHVERFALLAVGRLRVDPLRRKASVEEEECKDGSSETDG